jgi:hypothetical protein
VVTDQRGLRLSAKTAKPQPRSQVDVLQNAINDACRILTEKHPGIKAPLFDCKTAKHNHDDFKMQVHSHEGSGQQLFCPITSDGAD